MKILDLPLKAVVSILLSTIKTVVKFRGQIFVLRFNTTKYD